MEVSRWYSERSNSEIEQLCDSPPTVQRVNSVTSFQRNYDVRVRNLMLNISETEDGAITFLKTGGICSAARQWTCVNVLLVSMCCRFAGRERCLPGLRKKFLSGHPGYRFVNRYNYETCQTPDLACDWSTVTS